MKELTPKAIALRISFLVATSVTIIVTISEYFFTTRINFWVIMMVLPVSFLASYIGFLIAIEKFIYKKIKLIYRTIHNLKLKKGDNQTEMGLNTDILSQVNTEVLSWDKTTKQEIERLKGLENYRREFVGNVSHELKTPIFNIQGYLLTLLEGGLEDPKINRDYLRKANKSVERMITIIEDLDEITKMESEIIQMKLSKIDVVDLANEVLRALEMKAKENKITLTIQNDTNKPIWVLADNDRIAQVLINLIVNSIKYGNENGETIVKFFDMDENILIEVADNGIGIDEKHLPRLFERFYRTDKGRSREKGGLGLGLAIVKHIVEAHNQTINVRSTVDVGSTFSFTLKKA